MATTFLEKGYEAAGRDRANGHVDPIAREVVDFGEATDELDALGITDEDVRATMIDAWLDGYMLGQA